MPDNSDRYDLSVGDIVFILTALDALQEDLKDLLKNETTRASAEWHIELVKSTKHKLDYGEIQFSNDECRVMYLAGIGMRDLMNKMLDDHSCTEYDREMARSTLHTANAMLRVLRKTFIENGIDVDDLIPQS